MTSQQTKANFMLLTNLISKSNTARWNRDLKNIKLLLLSVCMLIYTLFCQSHAAADTNKLIEKGEIFKAPTYSIFENEPQENLRLLGIQLVQAGKGLIKQEDIITINPQELLDVNLHWLPGHDIDTKIPILLQFSTRDGIVKRTIETQIGPEVGELWKAGGIYQHHHVTDMRSITLSFSGAATMSVHVGQESTLSETQNFQLLLNLRLLPLIELPDMETSRYPEFFGSNNISLNKRFRLGSGVTQRIDIEQREDHSFIGIGLISAYGYNSVPQSKKVGVCRVYSNGQILVELPILSGIHTARSDYDFDPQGRDHQKIAIIESEEADYLDVNGAPFLRHKYVSKLPSAEMAKADSIEFEMLARGTLDIFDIVILMDEN